MSFKENIKEVFSAFCRALSRPLSKNWECCKRQISYQWEESAEYFSGFCREGGLLLLGLLWACLFFTVKVIYLALVKPVTWIRAKRGTR